MIRWLWSRMMKWGWDFNRNLRDDRGRDVQARDHARARAEYRSKGGQPDLE